MAQRDGRDPRVALLDAAEVILERDGFAGISTRKLAAEARINAGLVYYYFDSIEDLCAQVMQRVSADLISLQRNIFSGEGTLATQWHLATEPLRSVVGRRRMKVWFELSAMALSQPSLLPQMVEVNAQWRQIIRDGLEQNVDTWRSGSPSSGVSEGFSIDAMAALVSVVLKGLYWENLQEFHEGHLDLLAAADSLLKAIDASQASSAG